MNTQKNEVGKLKSPRISNQDSMRIRKTITSFSTVWGSVDDLIPMNPEGS